MTTGIDPEQPLVVVWRVTARCNLACPFCAYDRTWMPEVARGSAEVGEILRFGELLAGWKAQTGLPVLVSWLGGEPLLWAPLTSLTECFRRDHGFAVTTTTNGTTLSKASVRQHLLDCYSELTVSVDGLAPVHDALRGRPGLFDQLRQFVPMLAGSSSLLLRANVVLQRATLADFPALCRELAGWGIREISWNQLGGIDRPQYFPENRLLPEDVARLRAWWPDLRDELAGRGVRLLGSAHYLRRFEATAAGIPLPVDDCGPGRRFLFITETGKVSPCSFTTAEYGIDLRDLRSVADLGELPERFRRVRRQSRASACDDCHSTQVSEKFARAS